jgi:hypothetical protein
MPPRTRQSQTKGNTASPAGAENKCPIPLETTTLANVNTSTRGSVMCRWHVLLDLSGFRTMATLSVLRPAL